MHGRAWPLMLKFLPIMLFAVLKQIDILISKILDTVNNLLKLTCTVQSLLIFISLMIQY